MIISLLGAIAEREKAYIKLAICLVYIKIAQSQGPEIRKTLDYEINQCGGIYTLSDTHVYELIAFPRQNLQTGHATCYNQFKASPGRTVKIYVKQLKIGSCGVFVNIYDGDEKMNREPKWKLGCRGSENVYESTTNDVIVRLIKPVADSTNLYNFQIFLTSDQGPVIDITTDMSSGGGLASGAIIGIAIGASLFVVVIGVVIAVVACRYMKDKEKNKYVEKGPTVYTTSSSKTVGDPPPQGILKRSDSKGRGSKRRQRPTKAEEGYDNRAYRGSVDGDSLPSKVDSLPDGDESVDHSYRSRRSGRNDDVRYEEETRRDGRGSMGRRSRPQRRDNRSSDDYDSVFDNRAYQDDDVVARPPRRKDLENSSFESSTVGTVSYWTDTTNRSRTDSPSRSSRGSSTATEGTGGHRYVRNEQGRRSNRKRSNSHSSSKSGERRTGRRSHSSNNGHAHHGPSSADGGSHGRRSRSRSRERPKKVEAVLPIFAEAKKKRKK